MRIYAEGDGVKALVPHCTLVTGKVIAVSYYESGDQRVTVREADGTEHVVHSCYVLYRPEPDPEK